MLSFKKIGVLSLLLSSGLLLGLAFANNSTSSKSIIETKATEEWSEELTAVNLVIKYAKTVVDDSTADYTTAESGRYSFFVRHGYLTNNKCFKYDTVTGNGTTSGSFTSDTATDSSCVHWKWTINNGKLAENTEDGIIVGITANTPMDFSIDTMTFKGNPNSGRANTYVKRNGINAYLSVQSAVIANTSTEYSQSSIALNEGDTVYFEYIQLYGTGNLQSSSGAGLPVFKFKEYGNDPVEKTLTSTDIARSYYTNAIQHDADADYADDATLAFKYGIRHGKIEANIVEKFDTITNASNNISYSQSSDTDSTHAGITYGKNLWSANDDGVIFVFKALKPLSFSFASLTYAGGWTTNVHHTFAIKESGSSSFIIVSRWQYSGTTQAVNPILLNTGDEMYFEFRYAWSSNPRRSVQDNSDTGNVPTFILTDTNVSTVPVEANTFMAKFMKLATVATDVEGTGQCVSAGWYSRAKAAFNAMSGDARELFLTDAAYADGAARLIKWATANGEEINASNLLVTASSNHFFINNSKQSSNIVLIVVIAVAISSLAFMGFAFFSRKRKHL